MQGIQNDFGIEDILLDNFREFFFQKTGLDLSKYNEKFLKSKISERLKKSSVSSFKEYFNKMILQQNIEEELDEMFHSIINRESDFIRYPDQFDFLINSIVPEINKDFINNGNSILNILSIGIALGQEPYSIAMILKDNENYFKSISINIDAVDIVKRNISFAKKAVYDKDLLRFFTRYKELRYKHLFLKYFDVIDDQNQVFKIRKDVKSMCRFNQLNIARDNIKKKYHIIFCRNVIMYLKGEEQSKAITNIHKSLASPGYLFLGHSESPIGAKDKFQPQFFKECVVYKKE